MEEKSKYFPKKCPLSNRPTMNEEKVEYYTTKKMWDNISHLIPKNKKIWEACMLNSSSKSIQYLRELGFEVVGNKEWDCFEKDEGDIIITNIPFTGEIKIKILERFLELDKPFIIILNSLNIYTAWFRELFKDNLNDIQLIIPRGKILFEEKINEEIVPCKKEASFYACSLAYKLEIPNKDLFLLSGNKYNLTKYKVYERSGKYKKRENK